MGLRGIALTVSEEDTVGHSAHVDRVTGRDGVTALMAASLVDRVQVTLVPVITGQNGRMRLFQGAADFDLELLESQTLDGNIQELTYRPRRSSPL